MVSFAIDLWTPPGFNMLIWSSSELSMAFDIPQTTNDFLMISTDTRDHIDSYSIAISNEWLQLKSPKYTLTDQSL